MKRSVSRLESFSDGVIAIIMTLMVLEIQLPEAMTHSELMEFGKSILIYGASFLVVGGQWNRHHRMLDEIEEVSNRFVWKNLIYLFCLSLVPLFMKWVIQFPFSVTAALGYATVYLFSDFACRVLFFTLLKENRVNQDLLEAVSRKRRFTFVRLLVLLLSLAGILALSFVLPEISIVCFIVFPAILSLSNLFLTDQQGKTGRRRRSFYEAA